MEAYPCPVCTAPTTPATDTDPPCTYRICTQCEFIQKEPAAWLAPDAEKARYETHIQTIEDQGYVDFLSNFIQFAVRPFSDKIESALDFGCGHGPVLVELLKREGIDAAGYDPFFYPEDSLFDDTYDCITSVEVFEHLQDPARELFRLHASLKPSGILAIQTHFRPLPIPEFLTWWYKRDPTHIGFYTQKTFQKICDRFGFRLITQNDKNICVMEKL